MPPVLRFGVGFLGIVLTSCAGTPFGLTGSSQSTLTFDFKQLRVIEQAYGHYEAWGVVDGLPRSLGAFLIGADGKTTSLEGAPKSSFTVPIFPQAFSEILISQELPNAPHTLPSKQIFLRGAIKDGKTTLAAPIAAADVQDKTGMFLLDNPVTAAPNDWNGVWFSRFENGRYYPGLTLGESPDGWMYAGWVILNGVVLRTGKFRVPDENDDWYGYSGQTSVSLPVNFPGPPMPGEDFNKYLPAGIATGSNLPDLAGARVIISLESATEANEETYPAPLHIFEGTVASPSVQKVNYAFTNVASSSLPSGTVAIK